ncbi:MAG: hypothetical protein Q4G22_02420 [Paracoccus sp. (in: a-proteobacteria)]|nr:hypothetical protein [Paracoccus sp. (in: a-proteobacteria)]
MGAVAAMALWFIGLAVVAMATHLWLRQLRIRRGWLADGLRLALGSAAVLMAALLLMIVAMRFGETVFSLPSEVLVVMLLWPVVAAVAGWAARGW